MSEIPQTIADLMARFDLQGNLQPIEEFARLFNELISAWPPYQPLESETKAFLDFAERFMQLGILVFVLRDLLTARAAHGGAGPPPTAN